MQTALVTASLLFALFGGAPNGAWTVDQAGEVVRQARPAKAAPVEYRPPSQTEKTRLQGALPRLMNAVTDGSVEQVEALRPELGAAGFELAVVRVESQQWLFVGEKEHRGAGGYVFRLGEVDQEILVQAPHAYFDRNTGEIAYRTFATNSVRGFYFNTLHRYTEKTSGHADGHPCDVAHQDDTFFQLFTTSFLQHRPDGTVLQIHGFDNDELRARGIDIVVSNGTRNADHATRQLADSLSQSWNVSSAVYGESTNRYGATTNVTGRWIRANLGRFIHVEVSAKLRAKPRPLQLGQPRM